MVSQKMQTYLYSVHMLFFIGSTKVWNLCKRSRIDFHVIMQGFLLQNLQHSKEFKHVFKKVYSKWPSRKSLKPKIETKIFKFMYIKTFKQIWIWISIWLFPRGKKIYKSRWFFFLYFPFLVKKTLPSIE